MTPVTPQQVLAWGDVQRELTEPEDEILELVVSVVTDMITKTCVPLDETTPDAAQDALMQLAVLMQSFRLWKRRETPEGISAVFDGVSALRVSGTDPDIRKLLDLYRSWGVA